MSKFQNYLKTFDITSTLTEEDIDKTLALLQIYGPAVRRTASRIGEMEEECYTSCPEVADEHSKEWIAGTVKEIITEMISSGELQISAQTPALETNGSSLAADDLAELGGVMGMFRTKG